MRLWLASIGGLAGVFGAAGVGLAAAGAHVAGGSSATTAGFFLLFHAAALLALCAVGRASPRAPLLVSATLLAVGTVLFSGDLALRSLAHVTLVRMAAPTGGVVMILAWLGIAVAVPLSIRTGAPSRP